MAESKQKKTEGFAGRHVEIFLKTPLFRFRYKLNGEEKDLMENAVRISGKVLEDRSAGVFLQPELLSNMKESDHDLPFDKIFIPYGKIDFLVVD